MTKWVTKKLGEILAIGNGQDYKHLHTGEVPVYGTGGVLTFVDDYLYDGETVCIGRKGTINKPIYFEGKIWTVDTLFYTHSFVDVLPKYVYYAFCCIDWLRYNEATGVPSLSKETIYKIEIPVPDLAEQRRIAGILSSADGTIAASEALIEKYRNIKRGLLATLLQPKEGWKKVKLGECASLQGGFAFQSRDFSDNGIPLVRIGDITPKGLKNSNSVKLPNSFLSEYADFALINNDTIIAMSGATVGKCTLVTEQDIPALLNQRVGRFKVKNDIDKKFLFYIVSSFQYQQKLLVDAIGGAQPNVSPKQIESVECFIPVQKDGTPDLAEQRRIAEILSSVDAKIAAEEKVVEKYKGVKKGLMEELLKSEK